MSLEIVLKILDRDGEDIETVQEEVTVTLREAGFAVAPKGVSIVMESEWGDIRYGLQ